MMRVSSCWHVDVPVVCGEVRCSFFAPGRPSAGAPVGVARVAGRVTKSDSARNKYWLILRCLAAFGWPVCLRGGRELAGILLFVSVSALVGEPSGLNRVATAAMRCTSCEGGRRPNGGAWPPARAAATAAGLAGSSRLPVPGLRGGLQGFGSIATLGCGLLQVRMFAVVCRMRAWAPPMVIFFLPLLGCHTPRNRTEQNQTTHTKPAPLPLQTEVGITGAGCFVEAGPRQTEKSQFCGLTSGVTVPLRIHDGNDNNSDSDDAKTITTTATMTEASVVVTVAFGVAMCCF